MIIMVVVLFRPLTNPGLSECASPVVFTFIFVGLICTHGDTADGSAHADPGQQPAPCARAAKHWASRRSPTRAFPNVWVWSAPSCSG
jgi:hypothetical protein